jgi:hypothetical protein
MLTFLVEYSKRILAANIPIHTNKRVWGETKPTITVTFVFIYAAADATYGKLSFYFFNKSLN